MTKALNIMDKKNKGVDFIIIALFLTIALMCALVYKALDDYRKKTAIEDKLLGLFMIGYIVSFFYLDFSVTMTIFASLMAGCIVNGDYKAS